MDNRVVQTQTQEQQLTQEQRLNAKQILCSQLTELSIQELAMRIDQELEANPVLERDSHNQDEDGAAMTDNDAGEHDNNAVLNDPEDGDNDVMPLGGIHIVNEQLIQEVKTFRDTLLEQMMTMELTDVEKKLMEYLIDSLEDDGRLHRSISDLTDELAFNEAIYVSEEELETVLAKLQDMEPAGVGARSLQECLSIQLRRRSRQTMMTRLLQRAITDYWDDIEHSRWEVLSQKLQLSDEGRLALQQELMHLNPRPGVGGGENITKPSGVITPDFIVQNHDDGHLTVSLNNAYSAELCISNDEQEMLKQMQEARTRREREAKKFLEMNIFKAQNFMDALKQRENTLLLTMHAIVNKQRQWFREGDEEMIRPMKLEDIAEQTGLDVSTVSRACKNKYVDTQWGTYELKWFFGDEARQVKLALKALVEQEDARHPLSDEKLRVLLAEQGYDVARRTVAKYREAMKIPTSQERRR